VRRIGKVHCDSVHSDSSQLSLGEPSQTQKPITIAFEVGHDEVGPCRFELLPGIVARRYTDCAKARFFAGVDVQRGVSNDKRVGRRDASAAKSHPVLRRTPHQFGAIFSIRAKASKPEVGVQISSLKLNAGTALDISGSETTGKTRMLLETLEEIQNPGQDAIAGGVADFVGKKPHVGVKNATDRVRGVASRTSADEDFPDNRRVGLPMRTDTVHGILQSNYLLESPVERTDSRATGKDKCAVDIPEEQLHAAYSIRVYA